MRLGIRINRGPQRACFPLGALAVVSWCGYCFGEQEDLPINLPPVVVLGSNSLAQPQRRDLPATITELSGNDLYRGGIFSTVDLGRAVPNFSQSHGGLRSYSDTYSIRGVGNTEFLSDPAVVLYVDEVASGSVTSYATDLLVVDHVEVHRGPQGSRFGKNAEAGVINIVTRQPRNFFEGGASASRETFDTQRYEAWTQGPLITNSLFFGLAGQYSSSEGFIQNTFRHSHADEREGFNGRAILNWEPACNWQVGFTATGDRFNDGIGLVSLAGDPHQTRSDFDGNLAETINSQSLRVTGTLADVTLISVTARQDFHLDPLRFDLDFSPLSGNTGSVRQAELQWSEELRIRPATPGENWNWQAGFYFSTMEQTFTQRGDFFVSALGISGSDIIDALQDSATYALFGQCVRTLWSKLEVTAGLRLEDAVRRIRRTRNSTFGSPPAVHADGSFLNASPRLTLAWHLTEDVFFYGSTGTGFKPGGFSAHIDPPASPKFSTETEWANEVGLKSSWLGGKAAANIALFYYDIDDYQVEQFTPSGFNFTIVNAPRARSLGVEVELSGRPLTGLEISAFCGYTDARLTRYTNPSTGETFHNTHPPFVSDFNSGVAAQYTFHTGFVGRIEYATFGRTFFDAANSPSLGQTTYGLLGARVGFVRRCFGIFLFGENLTDTTYFTKKIPPLNAGAPGRPRLIGMMAEVKY